MLYEFLSVLGHYAFEIVPLLAVGFFLSGLIHEFVPGEWVEKRLGQKGIAPVFYATFVGMILPICCIGALPVAISFHKKGARLGPVLAFLVATPATSVTAILIVYQLLGVAFAVYIFCAVLLMGLCIGAVGNIVRIKLPVRVDEATCPHCAHEMVNCVCGKSAGARTISVLKFAFVEMPKEIGLELLLGLALAAAVTVIAPIGGFIKQHLSSTGGLIFGLIFGLLMYICSTSSVPLVDALIKQGMSRGGGMVLLLAGPITSYGAILVLRKEFGMKVLGLYLATICIFSFILGWLFELTIHLPG